jgi:hypothetical protein
MNLLKSLNEFAGDQQSLKTSDGNDAGSTDVKSYNVSFNMLRNTINSSSDGNVQASDVNDYLERAHEMNNEVDTVEYGLETDDGRIIKVWVNAADAQGFQDEMQHLLGVENDIEEAINTLASKFDIVDVVWPDASQTTADVPGESDDLGVGDDLEAADAETVDGAELARAALDKINGTKSSKKDDKDKPEDEEEADTEDKEKVEGEEDDEEDEDGKKKKKKDDEDKPTNESGDPMSIGTNFLKRILEADDAADIDGINDGLNVKLDPRQRSIMLRLRRAIDRQILTLFAMVGVPGRYMDVEGIDGLIKEAGLRLRSSPTQKSAFDQFYQALGAAKGFGIEQPAPVQEAENLRGAFIQKMLEAVLVQLGLPESLVTSSGPPQVGIAMYSTAKLIEDDGALEAALRRLAQRMKISTAPDAMKVDEEVEVGGDQFLEEIVALIQQFGVPEANLVYQRSNVMKGLREFKLSLTNRAMIQQRVRALTALIKTNTRVTPQAGKTVEQTNESKASGWLVVKMSCTYDKNGRDRSGKFVLVVPVKNQAEAEAVQGGIQAADWMSEHDDLMHKVAQNLWDGVMVDVDEVEDDNVEFTTTEPATAMNVFYASAKDF